MINIKHLKAFIAVAAELHFTKAAEKVCLTQPALSSLIQQLEQDFGVQLVRRHTRQVELTEAGNNFRATNLGQQLLGQKSLDQTETNKS